MRATGYITKKLTRMLPQSTLRRLVMVDSFTCPAMSKPMRSPSFRPSSLASPSSTLAPSASSGTQRPATTWLWTGWVDACDRLNSRSARRRPRSVANASGLTGWPLMLTRRPRIMGYQSNRSTPAALSRAWKASLWSGCTLMTKRLGASGGVALRHESTRSVRSSTSSISASRPTASELTCTTA